jgi:hypothetical protein
LGLEKLHHQLSWINSEELLNFLSLPNFLFILMVWRKPKK